MTSNCEKFRLLLWKNLLLRVRHPIRLAIEILAPFLILLGISLFRYYLKVEVGPGKIYKPFCVFPSQNRCTDNEVFKSFKSKYLVYAPRHNGLDLVMNQMRPYFKEIVGFNRKNSINRHFLTKLGSQTLAGIQINGLKANRPLPARLNIVLRFPAETYLGSRTNKTGVWNTDKVFYPHSESSPPRYSQSDSSGDPDYYKEGFLALQQAFVYSLIKAAIKKDPNDLPYIELHRYPYAPWSSDIFIIKAVPYLPIILSYIFLIPFLILIMDMTKEEENKTKFLMSFLGLPDWLNWLAWFIHAYIFFLYETLLIIIFMTTKLIYEVEIFGQLTCSVYLLILTVYVINTILSCFLISILCPHYSLATILSILLFVVESYPVTSILHNYQDVPRYIKMLCCLIPKSALYLFHFILCNKEIRKSPTNWSNILEIEEDDTIAIGDIILMLIIDIFLLAIAILYVKAVHPSHGKGRPFYLINCSKKKYADIIRNNSPTQNSDYFEPYRPPDNSDSTPACRIRLAEVTKIYENTAVVSKLSLEVYSDEVVAILGHGGTGKSTLVNILAGLVTPTGGSVYVEGDVGVKSVGLCCQRDILFPELNVLEHLYFFLVLKGVEKEMVYGEVEKYVKWLELQEHEQTLSKHLSKNDKRKLCVAIAFCGDPKTVILDEPTSGMDALVVQSFWDFIETQKSGRAILLATSQMIEAVAVADRIAILSEGQIICSGTSQFLRNALGAGYKFIFKLAEGAAIDAITEFLRKRVAQLQISESGLKDDEVVYSLPNVDSRIFCQLLEDLEKNMARLRVEDYRIKMISLEEVYMTVDIHNKALSSQSDSYQRIMLDDEVVDFGTAERHSGCRLLLHQFQAMVYKVLYVRKRYWPVLVIQSFLPLVFVFLSSGIGHIYIDEPMPMRLFSIMDYQNPAVLVSGDKGNPYYRIYTKVLNKTRILHTENITQTMIQLSGNPDTAVEIDYSYAIGADFQSNKLTAWFNGDLYHASPLSLSLILNSVYRHYMGEGRSVFFINFPLAFKADTKIEQYEAHKRDQPLFTSLSMGVHFSIAMLVIYYAKERYRGFKRLQLITGLRIQVYWISAFFSEIIILQIIIITITLVLILRDKFEIEHTAIAAAVTTLFGASSIVFVFLMSLCFKYPMTAFAFTIIIGLLMELVVSSVDILLDHLGKAGLLDWIYYCSSYMLYGNTLKKINVECIIENLCNNALEQCLSENITRVKCVEIVCNLAKQCCNRSQIEVITNIAVTIAYFVIIALIVLMIDCKVFRFIYRAICNAFITTNKDDYDHVQEEIDKDVIQEALNIRGTHNNELFKKYEIIFEDVAKYYNRYYVIKDFFLTIESGETFGIVGVTGAGKTTLFKMITGTVLPTSGHIYISGVSSSKRRFREKALIGYCPQVDNLIHGLTLRQTLLIFSLIRGIPRCDIKTVICNISTSLGFTKYLNSTVGNVSAGVKRLLSIAIAILGEPPIICLDEPTCGMDVYAKQKVWVVLKKLREKGKIIVFSTNSMEECEALSTRMAIIVNGKLKCLGTREHLKGKFAKGQFIIVKSKRNATQGNLADIDMFMQRNFKKALLTEMRHNMRTYEIYDKEMSWSREFQLMEEAKKKLEVESYSIGDRNLEHVFLSFSRFQH